MLKINPSKQIIYFFLALFLASAIYLFIIDSRYNNPKYNSNWFALSFVDPKSDKLDFTIENFSVQANFHWEILADTEKISQGDVQVPDGTKNEIKINNIVSDKKITIRVSIDQDIQEIYKNIKQ